MYVYVTNFALSNVKHVDNHVDCNPRLVRLFERLKYNVKFGIGHNMYLGQTTHSVIFESKNDYQHFIDSFGNEYNGSNEPVTN